MVQLLPVLLRSDLFIVALIGWEFQGWLKSILYRIVGERMRGGVRGNNIIIPFLKPILHTSLYFVYFSFYYCTSSSYYVTAIILVITVDAIDERDTHGPQHLAATGYIALVVIVPPVLSSIQSFILFVLLT